MDSLDEHPYPRDAEKRLDPLGMSSISKKVNVKSGGKLMAVVREQYIRNDLSCRSLLCKNDLCDTQKNPNSSMGCLPDNVTHYLIPFIDVAGHYMEILELPDITGIIFLQTVVNAIKLAKGGQYRRLCSIVRDKKKSSTFFANEFFEPTIVVRNNEKLSDWRTTVVHTCASWFYEHLGKNFKNLVIRCRVAFWHLSIMLRTMFTFFRAPEADSNNNRRRRFTE